MVPDEEDQHSINKEKILASIDVSLGGHIAEKLLLGDNQVTTGCGSDLHKATSIAYEAVRKYGMFGEDAGFASIDQKDVSQEHNSTIDEKVKQILDESFERVSKLLTAKDIQMRDLSRNLYWYDYLDSDEIDKIMKGEELKKDKVRKWEGKDSTAVIF